VWGTSLFYGAKRSVVTLRVPVLKAMERDLRGGMRSHIASCRPISAAAALDLIEKLRERGEPIALLMADHRMPQMAPIDLLSRTVDRLPDAKRVLPTACADTDAAIRTIDEVQLDYYLLKPWDPPERTSIRCRTIS
jgi:thioredoxin reductase (NADPH)